MRKPRAAFLWLSFTVLFGLSVRSVVLFAKGPSFEETIGFIILKLSGVSVSSQIECDRVRECGGSINTTWQSRAAPSLSSCSIEVIQTMNVTKMQNTICVWTGDVIGGKLWSRVTYQREYHFRLDLGSISRDGITVERETRENSHCFYIKSDLQYSVDQSDLPYSVHLTFTKGINVSFQLKATGLGNGEETTVEQEGTDTWNNDSLPVGGKDIAERLARAFNHAASLCEAKKEVF
jgi:hypothetical protein